MVKEFVKELKSNYKKMSELLARRYFRIKNNHLLPNFEAMREMQNMIEPQAQLNL